MPSPFPGMDPYIEDPEVWSDFHSDLAGEIRAQLNPLIQPAYVARLVPRVTYDVVEVTRSRGIRPDVGVWKKTPTLRETTGPPATTIPPAPAESSVTLELPLRLHTIEIHRTGEMELVTAIEILSPVNKRPGHDAQRDYERKRRELLRSHIDYESPAPPPPLPEHDASWLAKHLAKTKA